MRLNVRCCCEGTKIYGTLPVPVGAIERGSFTMVLREPGFKIVDGLSLVNTKAHTIQIRPIVINGRDEPAIYSDDRPIEFWRKLPGFEEVQA